MLCVHYIEDYYLEKHISSNVRLLFILRFLEEKSI